MSPEIESLLALLNDEGMLAVRMYETECPSGYTIGPGFAAIPNEPPLAWYERNKEKLAFRLRDESVASHWLFWHRAVTLVRDRAHLHGMGIETLADYAQPKHFILAALIAKKMKEQP